MLARLIQFALTQRLLILILIGLLAAVGYHAFRNLPIDAFPDISPTQVKIIIKAPGMTPQEVEERITAPVELELLGIPDQTMLRSITKYALTDITIDFAAGTDIYWARQQVAERLNGAWESLPDGVEGGIAPMTTPLGDMFMFTIEGGELSLTDRRRLLDWVIRPALRTVPGVADVNSLGGFVRSFEIVPDPVRLAARGLTIADLTRAIETNNRNDGAGRLIEGEENLLLRTVGRITSPDDVRRIVVAVHDGNPVTVNDVADVRIGALTRYGAVTADGLGEAVEGIVLSLRGANAQQVIDGVRARLAELQSSLPDGVRVDVFYDRSDLVQRAVNTVSRALIEATVLVLITLILFLGNARAALTVVTVLPLAALMTFWLMRQFDMSANLMSLGGLAIAIGILVDAAVVVVENITRHLGDPERMRGRTRLHMIYRATQEVALPVTAGISIIAIVFLPLLTLQGIEGLLFAPVALTIVFALGGSLLLSLTAIPVFASLLLRASGHAEPWLPRQLAKLYQPLLSRALRYPRIVLAGAAGLFLIAAAAYTLLGKAFMPTMDEGDVLVQFEKVPSITLANSVALDVRIERAILDAVPEVRHIIARVGSDEIGMDPMGLNESDAFMVLAPESEWTVKTKDELIDRIREVLDNIPGLAFGFTQPIEMRTAEMLTGVRGDLAVKVFGPDLEILNDQAAAIADVLRTIRGASDVFRAQNTGIQYLSVELDRIAAGRLGLDADQLAGVLRAQVEGRKLSVVQEGNERTPLIIRGLAPDPHALDDLLLTLDGGIKVPLGSIAQIRRVDGVVSVAREHGSRFAVIRANVVDRDLVGFVEDAQRAVADRVALPAGYRLAWGGEFENQQRAAARLTIVVPIAISLVFFLLFLTFRSLRQAALVLLNIPFALIGGVFALLLTGEYLSVPASVGFIALVGIAVLNGVVLMSYFNQLRAQGLPVATVVTTGALRRLRPVLMTAMISALGLAPLLFAHGPGAEIQRPLAIVVIGGLVTSTALTLLLLPVLYRLFGEEPAT